MKKKLAWEQAVSKISKILYHIKSFNIGHNESLSFFFFNTKQILYNANLIIQYFFNLCLARLWQQSDWSLNYQLKIIQAWNQSLPVQKALTETGSTGCRSPPLWHLLFIEVLHAFWLILEQNDTDPSADHFHHAHTHTCMDLNLKVFELTGLRTRTSKRSTTSACAEKRSERRAHNVTKVCILD